MCPKVQCPKQMCAAVFVSWVRESEATHITRCLMCEITFDTVDRF